MDVQLRGRPFFMFTVSVDNLCHKKLVLITTLMVKTL